VQGRVGPKLSKHGVIITCSWCKGENHNSGGCSLKKLGISPSVHRNTTPTYNEETPIRVDNQSNQEATISQVMKHILPPKTIIVVATLIIALYDNRNLDNHMQWKI